MPMKPPRPCAVPHCPALIRGVDSRCPAHERQQKRRYNERRPAELKAFYSGTAWKDFRATQKAARPVCECQDPECPHVRWEGRCTRPTWAIDHIIEPMVDWSKALDPSNTQALCESCHNSKTARTQWPGRGQR